MNFVFHDANEIGEIMDLPHYVPWLVFHNTDIKN